MPITFTLVQHAANEVQGVASSTPEQLLQRAAPKTFKDDYSSLFSSSIGQGDQKDVVVSDHVGSQNGLVNTVLAAHNQHHALVLRPDDIWLTIVTQFSFFVNKHAEQLRGRFLAHTGQKHIELEVRSPALFDGAYLAPAFAKELSKHVTDVGLRQWTVPEFSTTTETDRIVGSVILMGAMKKYFSYPGASCLCGIARITLEGTHADWEEVLRRGDRLAEYGDKCVLWHRMLMAVLRRFVATFDDPRLEKAETREFWENMVQYKNPGSGQPYITGWLTVFCMFDEDGNWKGRPVCLIMSCNWNTNIDSTTEPRTHVGWRRLPGSRDRRNSARLCDRRYCSGQ